jgi:GT2 family glycosyltransferase
LSQISVIIPTVGRPSLQSTLTALAAQQEPPPFEIIIAVDGPAVPDVRDTNMPTECIRVHLIRMGQRQGVSAARNAALGQANGQLLGFLDDDVLPDPGWMKSVCKNLAAFDAVAGRIIEDDRTGTLAKLRRLAFDHRHSTNLAQGELVDYLNGGNFAIRADAMHRVGGFNTQYTKSQDREVARRLLHAGLSIGYAPGMIVHHSGSYTLGNLLRGRYKAGQAAAAMMRDGGATAAGPTTVKQTYGESLTALARRHGTLVAATAALSVAAHRAGRQRPLTTTSTSSST